MKRNLSRRQLLQAAGATAGAAAVFGGLERKAKAQTAPQSAVLLVFLRGGYNALFTSADSFSSYGTFGCSPGNVKSLGNGLVIDNATFGTNLPSVAQANMAALGVNHGLSSHDPARLADWTNSSGRSYPLILANAMGGSAAIRCAVLGSTFPDGPAPAEGNVSMQQITDLKATLAAIGSSSGTTDPSTPNRPTAAAALSASRTMSQGAFGNSPNSLKSLKEAYDTSITALGQSMGTSFDYATIAGAYGISSTSFGVSSFKSQMLAAEVMIRAGCKVCIAVTGGWDTHGDSSGSTVRSMMNNNILPGLKVFLQRMMSDTAFNVTTLIFGDFARSLPGSDHAHVLSATVFGKRVKVGTTGKVSSSVGLPTGSPSIPGMWAFMAAASNVTTTPFGTNPHTSILL